uniref:Secreted protein n=1 Tax=Glossina palpalis gambiensis TaxID=67801 RepID=A0A1B0ANJ8_9MUSC
MLILLLEFLAIRLTLLGSSSYSINTVQPRTPQGSRSDTRTMSVAMRIVRSLGKDTSVQFACTPPLINLIF